MRIDDELAAVVGRVAGGDHGAFAVLYDRLAPLVYGVSRRVLGDASHAEEVTQEVFVELWRHAPRFDGSRGSVRAWAATIARRRAVDRVRSEQAHRGRHHRDPFTAGVNPAGPEEVVIDHDQRRRAVAALAQLSGAQREALELAYFGGLTHVEIAERLDIPLGTLKTRVRDGLLRLRTAMEEVP